MNFRTLTQTDLDAIAQELNERPRLTLEFKTPSQARAKCCDDPLNPHRDAGVRKTTARAGTDERAQVEFELSGGLLDQRSAATL